MSLNSKPEIFPETKPEPQPEPEAEPDPETAEVFESQVNFELSLSLTVRLE